MSLETVQRRYPPNERAFSTTYSSIELAEEAFSAAPRYFVKRSGPVRLISVGTLEVLYKGFDVLIDAVAACTKAGLDVQLVIVGEGRCKPELEAHARHCGIARQVHFAGRLPPGEAVRTELDRCDLFVLASKTEGLPRAMIEGMARGLPCIGSAVGGIPELLDAEDLVPAGDPAALARKITEVASDPKRMTQMSTKNLAKARDYHASLLTERRREFYQYLQQATLQWIQRQPSMAAKSRAFEDTNPLRVAGLDDMQSKLNPRSDPRGSEGRTAATDAD